MAAPPPNSRGPVASVSGRDARAAKLVVRATVSHCRTQQRTPAQICLEMIVVRTMDVGQTKNGLETALADGAGRHLCQQGQKAYPDAFHGDAGLW